MASFDTVRDDIQKYVLGHLSDSAEDVVAVVKESHAAADIGIDFLSVLQDALRGALMQHILNEQGSPDTVARQMFSIAWEACSKHSDGWKDGRTELPFVLLEDVLDLTPIAECPSVWQILEEHQTQYPRNWMKTMSRAKLAVLRIANRLLKRLSKTRDTVFRGRILIFQANIFPLSDRSGVNLAGTVDTANVTLYETPPSEEEAKHSEGDRPFDWPLYTKFWGIQHFLRDPKSIFKSADNWSRFQQELDVVLEAFSGIMRGDAQHHGRSSKKRNIDEISGGAEDAFYCTKYLTSRELFDLQLQDPTIQRNLLTQLLIVIRYLKRLDPPEGVKCGKDLSQARDKVTRLLRRTPPDGVEYTATLSRFLHREEAWTKWKSEQCPAFEKDSVELTVGKPPSKPAYAPKKRQRTVTWASAVSGKESIESYLSDPASAKPDLSKFLDPLFDALEPDSGVEAEFHPSNNPAYMYRALRLMAEERISSFKTLSAKEREAADQTEKSERKPFEQVIIENYPHRLPQVEQKEEEKEEEGSKGDEAQGQEGAAVKAEGEENGGEGEGDAPMDSKEESAVKKEDSGEQ